MQVLTEERYKELQLKLGAYALKCRQMMADGDRMIEQMGLDRNDVEIDASVIFADDDEGGRYRLSLTRVEDEDEEAEDD